MKRIHRSFPKAWELNYWQNFSKLKLEYLWNLPCNFNKSLPTPWDWKYIFINLSLFYFVDNMIFCDSKYFTNDCQKSLLFVIPNIRKKLRVFIEWSWWLTEGFWKKILEKTSFYHIKFFWRENFLKIELHLFDTGHRWASVKILALKNFENFYLLNNISLNNILDPLHGFWNFCEGQS